MDEFWAIMKNFYLLYNPETEDSKIIKMLTRRLVFWSFFLMLSLSCREKETPVEGPGKEPVEPEKFWYGVDLSYVNEIEDYGGVYRDTGIVRDPFVILSGHGADLVRVRLWYNPQWVGVLTGGNLYSDLYDAETTIRRAKEAGMEVCLDLHYSDTWADPGTQETPEAWKQAGQEALRDSVYVYTLRVLTYLEGKDLTPEMVQIGNETNSGMLWPAGKAEGENWQAFGLLLNSGIRAVRDFSASSDISPMIILHVAQLQHASWWIGQVVSKGGVTDFDILGISHYPKWSTVNNFTQITTVISTIRQTYNKKVMIVETAYPWTAENYDQYTNIMGPADSIPGFPLTPAGQKEFLVSLTRAVKDGGGCGVIYWEPAWITSAMKDKWGTGSSWENCTLFDFSGNALESMDYLNKSNYY